MQLFLVCLALAVGFTVFGAWTWHTISQTRIGGPGYNCIVLYKDLVAGILSPPNYIIESYPQCPAARGPGACASA
ncbi:MAG TPA: hypothetical protein DGC76_12270 [Candidatus Accumulibacter sp.]|nr:hypothetical protein [Accumulibacter sp.]HCV14452.1 hypothetical protein [Accumulibacter sp.]